MYAVLRINSFDHGKLASSSQTLDAFDKVHSAQPGYLGSVVVELGHGRCFALNLWQSHQHSLAALSVLGNEVERLLDRLMSSPSEFIGAGTVISSDPVPSAGA